MRLGAYPCVLSPDSRSHKLYGKDLVQERHRHRYEFNPRFREELEKSGLKIVGTSPDNKLVEVVEIPEHPYFVGCQFHPEFKSRPRRPHPLFSGLIRAALQHKGE